MRLARVRYHDDVYHAEVTEDGLRVRTEAGDRLVEPAEVELLPVSAPTKIIGIGWNFPKHIDEMKGRLKERGVEQRPREPIVFLKPPSCLISDGEPIVIPHDSQQVEYEGELTAVIGRRCRRVSPEEAGACIAGWTCGNDVTERRMQREDKQWWRAKGYDTFGAVGRYLETERPDPEARVRTLLNGELRQEGMVGEMLFDPATIVSFLSQAVTLEPGDLILLGTPPGVGGLAPGDEVEVTVEGVGSLRNPVIAEGDR